MYGEQVGALDHQHVTAPRSEAHQRLAGRSAGKRHFRPRRLRSFQSSYIRYHCRAAFKHQADACSGFLWYRTMRIINAAFAGRSGRTTLSRGDSANKLPADSSLDPQEALPITSSTSTAGQSSPS